MKRKKKGTPPRKGPGMLSAFTAAMNVIRKKQQEENYAKLHSGYKRPRRKKTD